MLVLKHLAEFIAAFLQHLHAASVYEYVDTTGVRHRREFTPVNTLVLLTELDPSALGKRVESFGQFRGEFLL